MLRQSVYSRMAGYENVNDAERRQRQGKEVVFRADAAFAKPEICEALEERNVKYAIRVPSNDSLERDIAELLTRLSCHRFRSSEVRLWLSVIAYNLGNLWRGCPLGPVLPLRVGNWSLTSPQQRLVKTGGRLIKHARYFSEGHLTRRSFGAMVRRIPASPMPTG